MDMDNQINGCLFVGSFGIFKVYCDFLVVCLLDIDSIAKDDVVTVTEVRHSESGRMVFLIKGVYYYHFYFALYIEPPFRHPPKSKES